MERTITPEAQAVIDALDTMYPPTNPAVLLSAAREAYLAGDHKAMVRLVAWMMHVEALWSPESFDTERAASTYMLRRTGRYSASASHAIPLLR